jgi:hypothetical protein
LYDAFSKPGGTESDGAALCTFMCCSYTAALAVALILLLADFDITGTNPSLGADETSFSFSFSAQDAAVVFQLSLAAFTSVPYGTSSHRSPKRRVTNC